MATKNPSKIFLPVFVFSLLFGAGVVLSGCNTTTAATALFDGSIFDQRSDFNLRQSSYAAADMLAQQAGGRLSARTSLRVGVLRDMNRTQNPGSFGQVVPAYIGARLVQLGYPVNAAPSSGPNTASAPAPAPTAQTSETAQASGAPQSLFSTGEQEPQDAPPPPMAPPAPAQAEADAEITGYYVVAGRNVMVTAQIIKTDDGRVLSVYDYTIPLNRQIRELINVQHPALVSAPQ